MPFMTTPERIGLEKGLLRGIEPTFRDRVTGISGELSGGLVQSSP